MNPFATFLVGASILMMLLVYIGTAVHKTKRIVGTLLGGAAGALAGKAIDQNQSQVRCR